MPVPVIDCHSDVMIDVFRRRRAGERAVLQRLHIPKHAKGGVVASICTVGGDPPSLRPLGWDKPYENALALIDAIEADVAESEGQIAIVTTAEELKACVAKGTYAILLGFEGAGPFEGDVERIEECYGRGIRVVGLTHNVRNEFAVGMESGAGGLTAAGVEAVTAMNELGILIDLAHASPTSFWDAADITKAPLFVSHANAKALRDHERNLDDQQLQAVSQSGGAVGLVFCPNFIAPHPVRLDQLLDHLDYMDKLVGHDALVIGADFIDFAIEEMMMEMEIHPGLYDEQTIKYPIGAETVASMQNVIEGMRERGYEPGVIDKVGSTNFLRVLEETQALAGVSAPAAEAT